MRRAQGRCLTPTTRLQLYTALGDARLLPIGGRQAKKLPAVDQTPHRRAQTPLHSPLATPLGGLSTPFATRRLMARRPVARHETFEGSARRIPPLLPSLLAHLSYSSPIPSSCTPMSSSCSCPFPVVPPPTRPPAAPPRCAAPLPPLLPSQARRLHVAQARRLLSSATLDAPMRAREVRTLPLYSVYTYYVAARLSSVFFYRT